jgi:hypothetical protein
MTDPVRTPYRFRVVRRNRAPEAVAARVVPGQVVAGERIDLPEDLDEFHVEAREGQQLTVFVEGLSGSRVPAVELHVISPAGVRFGAAQSLRRRYKAWTTRFVITATRSQIKARPDPRRGLSLFMHPGTRRSHPMIRKACRKPPLPALPGRDQRARTRQTPQRRVTPHIPVHQEPSPTPRQAGRSGRSRA